MKKRSRHQNFERLGFQAEISHKSIDAEGSFGVDNLSLVGLSGYAVKEIKSQLELRWYRGFSRPLEKARFFVFDQ